MPESSAASENDYETTKYNCRAMHLRNQPPDFLEQAVLDVLVAMGYGGTEQRATRIGGSGGVDGIIDQDPLGLDRVYCCPGRRGLLRIGTLPITLHTKQVAMLVSPNPLNCNSSR
ncbi:restriction endonuclease [Nocardia wallacei]|uniref:restriction endonuclease n=1 Tax=Nocardia wallacei TaxID=480035 RepID=UPI003CC7C4E1